MMRTPLHYVCQLTDDLFDSNRTKNNESKVLNTVKLLIKYGANPNIKDKNGKYAYQHSKDEAVINFLKMRTNEDDGYEDLR